MMLLMFMLMMMLRNPTIMMIEMFSLCDVQEGIDALDNADVFLGDGIEDSHDGDDRNVDDAAQDGDDDNDDAGDPWQQYMAAQMAVGGGYSPHMYSHRWAIASILTTITNINLFMFFNRIIDTNKHFHCHCHQQHSSS